MPGCARPGAGAAPPVPMAGGAGARLGPFPWAGGTRPCAPHGAPPALLWDWAHWGQRGAGLGPSQSLDLASVLNLGNPETLVAPGLWCVGSGHGIGPAPAPWSHSTLSAWPQRGQSRTGSCKRPQKATKNFHARDNTPFEPPSVTSGRAALPQHLPRRCQPRSRRCQALLHRPGSGSVAPAQRQRWGCSSGSRRDRNEQSHGAAETRARR